MTDISFIADLLAEPEHTYVPRKQIIPDKRPTPQQFDMVLIKRPNVMTCVYQQGREGERCTTNTYYLFQGLPFCWEHLALRFEWFITHNGEPWRYEETTR